MAVVVTLTLTLTLSPALTLTLILPLPLTPTLALTLTLTLTRTPHQAGAAGRGARAVRDGVAAGEHGQHHRPRRQPRLTTRRTHPVAPSTSPPPQTAAEATTSLYLLTSPYISDGHGGDG